MQTDLEDVNVVLVVPLLLALGVTLFMAKKQRAERGGSVAKGKPAKVKAAKAPKAPKPKMPKFKSAKRPEPELVSAAVGADPVPAAAPAKRSGTRQPRRGSVL